MPAATILPPWSGSANSGKGSVRSFPAPGKPTTPSASSVSSSTAHTSESALLQKGLKSGSHKLNKINGQVFNIRFQNLQLKKWLKLPF